MATEVVFTGESKAVWRYWTDRRLGAGHFGDVYAGEGSDGTPMAVKVIQKQRLFGALSDRLQRREVDIGRRVCESSADMLLPVVDAADTSDSLLLVMARADGALAAPLEEPEVLAVMTDIATGLQQLHAIGIIHRDLKPPNVLRHQGRWKLADFGIARDQEIGTQAATFIGWGSWPYMAPELWEPKSPTVKTDLYALGCIGYELLTGTPPFTGDQADIRVAHRAQVPPDLPISNVILKNLITRLLVKEPGGRPQDARAVLERLHRAVVLPAPALQVIAAGLGAHAQEKARAAAARTAAETAEEARWQHIEQAEADLREILSDAFEELRAVEPDATLERADDLSDPFILSTADVGLRVLLWQEPEDDGPVPYPHVPNDTMIIAGYVTIANRRHNPEFGLFHAGWDWTWDRDLYNWHRDYDDISRFPTTELNAANVVYEIDDDRLGWQIYKFRIGNRDQEVHDDRRPADCVYGPAERSFGLYRDRFLHPFEREVMLYPVGHAWTMTRAPLTATGIIELFQEAIDLKPQRLTYTERWGML